MSGAGPRSWSISNGSSACALAPLAVLDGQYHGQMNEAKADSILQPILRAGSPAQVRESGPGDEETS
jgi:hypothetical protein